MSIPIAFAFDFASVMALPQSAFLAGNFARAGSMPQRGNAAFDVIDFAEVYHDGPLTHDRMERIHNARMAEVVVPDALSLDHLVHVVCRTRLEETTLRYELARLGIALPALKLEQKASIFMRRGIFLDDLFRVNGEIFLSFHAPLESPQPDYEVKVVAGNGGIERSFSRRLRSGRWRLPDLDAPEDVVWAIEIEGCLAYRGGLSITPPAGRVV